MVAELVFVFVSIQEDGKFIAYSCNSFHRAVDSNLFLALAEQGSIHLIPEIYFFGVLFYLFDLFTI